MWRTKDKDELALVGCALRAACSGSEQPFVFQVSPKDTWLSPEGRESVTLDVAYTTGEFDTPMVRQQCAHLKGQLRELLLATGSIELR